MKDLVEIPITVLIYRVSSKSRTRSLRAKAILFSETSPNADRFVDYFRHQTQTAVNFYSPKKTEARIKFKYISRSTKRSVVREDNIKEVVKIILTTRQHGRLNGIHQVALVCSSPNNAFLSPPSPQPKQHLDRSTGFARLTSVTHRQTDRPRYSVENNRLNLLT